MKKQGKSPGQAKTHNGIKKKSGKNKGSLKDNKLKKGTMKFINDSKNDKDTKPLIEKLLSQGEVVKNPGKSPKKNKNKHGNKNKSKKGMAPIVNPDKDNKVHEESSDEEMNEDESPANSPKKNKKKNKKKKLGLLASKTENKENGENNEENEAEEKDDEKTPTNLQKAKPKPPKKFILFVGNLPYDVTKEQIGEHFKSVKDGVKEIRMSTHADTGKGKGYAFLEMPNAVAYKAAMKLNKQKMGERVIRVEYTTPGKSDNKNRKKHINNKTKKLLGQKKNKKGKGFNKKKGKGKK